MKERWERANERRRIAVRTCLAAGSTKEVVAAVASANAVAADTVRGWIRRERKGALVARAPGRRSAPLPAPLRRGVILSILLLGPYASEEVLRGRHANVPYRRLRRLKRWLARILRRREGLRRAWLRWHRPGRVWAVDFTTPEVEIEGPFTKLLVVRDLASGMQLAATAVTGETALAVDVVLSGLFADHGAPLVIKFDNGKPFLSHRVQRLFERHGVQALPSPVYRPQFNGSCERAGGHVKRRTANLAELAGHPEKWTVVDVERARVQANATARPFGARGPTPAEAFGRRRRIQVSERKQFHRTRAHLLEHLLKRYHEEHGRVPQGAQETAVARRATKQTLLELGYLTIRGGCISTPLSHRKGGGIA